MLEKLKNQTFEDGETGHIAFDQVTGDRIGSNYNIVNVITTTNRKGEKERKMKIVGSYFHAKKQDINSDASVSTNSNSNRVGGSKVHSASHMRLTLDTSSIEWPGGVKSRPRGYYVSGHLRVVTIAEKPFIWAHENRKGLSCPKGQVSCPKPGQDDLSTLTSSSFSSLTSSSSAPSSRDSINYCCEGYCVDLLNELASKLNFTFDLYQVADNSYGSYDWVNETRLWNGLVADVVNRKADMVVAPLTVNPQRAHVIDFSKPFKYQGIAMIQKRRQRKPKLESFVQPFKGELWLLVFLCVFLVAIVLYILDCYSPLGKPMMKNQRLTNEKSLNLSSAIWFSFGVLMNSGISEKTPMSFSARVLGMVWSGFSMIVGKYSVSLTVANYMRRKKMIILNIHLTVRLTRDSVSRYYINLYA